MYIYTYIYIYTSVDLSNESTELKVDPIVERIRSLREIVQYCTDRVT